MFAALAVSAGLPTPVRAQAAPAPVAGAAAVAAPAPVARVIVHWRDDASRATAAGGAERLGRLSSRLRLDGLQAGRAITERSQVLTARGLTSAQLVERLSRDPDVAAVEVDRRLKVAQTASVNDPFFGTVPLPAGPTSGQWFLTAPDSVKVSAINAVGAWRLTAGNRAVVVAVLDTGVRFDHPDLLRAGLGGNLLPGRDFIKADNATSFADGAVGPGSNFGTAGDGSGRDDNPSDPGDFLTIAEILANPDAFGSFPAGTTPTLRSVTDQGCAPEETSSWHGTQVAGLIGALTNNARGVASVGRTVRVLPVRVLGKCGGYTSDIAAGMRWAAGLPVPGEPANPTPAWVLNLSLGGGSGSCVPVPGDPGSPTLRDAVADVTAAGAVVVVAAGNSNGQAVSRPANCPGAIAVGAVRNTGTKVAFSDLGPEIAVMAPGGNCVNLSGDCLYPIVTTTNEGQQGPVLNSDAYTVGITRNGVEPSAGTSFSAPLVAGAAALVLSLRSDLTPSQVLGAIQQGARAFPAADPALPLCRAPDAANQNECNCTRTTCGAGLLDVERSVQIALTLPGGAISRSDTSAQPVTWPASIDNELSGRGPIDPAPSGGTGGGVLGPAWLLALLAAGGLLTRRRLI